MNLEEVVGMNAIQSYVNILDGFRCSKIRLLFHLKST